MKRLLALTLTLAMTLGICAGCGSKGGDTDAKSEGVMTYAEYDSAALRPLLKAQNRKKKPKLRLQILQRERR